jgi:hypothetical protein
MSVIRFRKPPTEFYAPVEPDYNVLPLIVLFTGGVDQNGFIWRSKTQIWF